MVMAAVARAATAPMLLLSRIDLSSPPACPPPPSSNLPLHPLLSTMDTLLESLPSFPLSFPPGYFPSPLLLRYRPMKSLPCILRLRYPPPPRVFLSNPFPHHLLHCFSSSSLFPPYLIARTVAGPPRDVILERFMRACAIHTYYPSVRAMPSPHPLPASRSASRRRVCVGRNQDQ